MVSEEGGEELTWRECSTDSLERVNAGREGADNAGDQSARREGVRENRK